ncbi:MAG TPA: FAD-dependent oxidoreductase [Bryobacteraceae bacterium]|nr:FAD-dependent oxidoreductase [Bryobacteraceae bacterium]
MAETQVIKVRCCIAGGGPAGMMLGFLLARAGVDVVVLEKHADFLRDFRGDTIHPSTLEVMHELGLLDEFLKLPHQEVVELTGRIGDSEVIVGDFSRLPTHCRFLAFMPQWDFLAFLAEHGKRYRTFDVRMETAVTGLIEETSQIRGLRAQTSDGPLEIRADLVVGADGRQSMVRQLAGLQVQDLGAPMDVLWMGVSKLPSDPRQVIGRFDRGMIMVMLDRGDYWQCGYVIPKGGFAEIQQKGLDELRANLVAMAPFLEGRVNELRDWNDIKLLTVKVDRLRKWWRPGLLCIGDAAHAMSPIGGVGINLAIQDAVAAANILAGPLRDDCLTSACLERVQSRREFPARLTQSAQVFLQKRVIVRVLGSDEPVSAPWPLRLLKRWRFLRGIPARLIGLGVRPEHVQTEERQR